MNNERITAITDINYNEITTTTGCNREWHSWEWDGNKSYTCGNKMEVGEKMWKMGCVYESIPMQNTSTQSVDYHFTIVTLIEFLVFSS